MTAVAGCFFCVLLFPWFLFRDDGALHDHLGRVAPQHRLPVHGVVFPPRVFSGVSVVWLGVSSSVSPNGLRVRFCFRRCLLSRSLVFLFGGGFGRSAVWLGLFPPPFPSPLVLPSCAVRLASVSCI